MTPRPVIRWKSFWLGILVLGFLGWAWVSTAEHFYLAQWNDAGMLVLVRSSRGTIGVAKFTTPVGTALLPSGGARRFSASHGATATQDTRWPSAVDFKDPEISGHYNVTSLSMAYWFLILLFLAVWSSWLFFHWKREQKKAAP